MRARARGRQPGWALLCLALLTASVYGQLPAVGDFPLTKTQAALHGAVSVANLHGIAASRAGAGFTWGAGGPWLGVSESVLCGGVDLAAGARVLTVHAVSR